ncbi:MAG: hypothetical protein HY899_18120 [Deltaproteobacteria bacterium]|nr:hypothetical protein [Deltaproteobacteria bacterium]
MNRPTRILLVAIVVIGLGLLFARGRDSRRASGDFDDRLAAVAGAQKNTSRGASQAAAGRVHGARSIESRSTPGASASAQLPDSLQGTDTAGALLVDEAGNFVATAEALDLFEYFFSATGEETPEQIVARIRDEIAKRLGPPADAQARAFLERYLLYRERGMAMGAGETEGAELRAGFERLKSLRREIFGEEIAAALFGDEEAQADVSIRQREIAADPDLSDDEKAARIQALYDELPEPLRHAHEQTLAVLNLQRDEARLRAQGGDDAAIRALRVERFGEGAADRLEALDRENAAWDSRLRDFDAERARILADQSLSAAARDAAIARLLQERFDERERIRVAAIDEASRQ